MEQKDILDHIYKGYIQYYSPIGLWLFVLIAVLVIEFGISKHIMYMLGLIAGATFLVPFVLDALSESKWKPHYWVDLNEYTKSHRKADNFFIYQMILAGCSGVIYFGIRMIRSTTTADERFGVMTFILFMIIFIILISALRGYSVKAMIDRPNIYYRFMAIEFNIICESFDEVLRKSEFSFISEFHQKTYSTPSYKRYLIKESDEESNRGLEIFLEPKK